MNCNDFWGRYDNSGIDDKLKKHLDSCESCRNEFKIEELLDKTVRILPDFKAPSSLWNNIVDSIPANRSVYSQDKSLIFRLRNVVDWAILPFKAVPWKPVFATFALLLFTVSITYVYFWQTPVDKISLLAQSEEPLTEIEQQYTADIAMFTALVEENKDSIDPDEYYSYQEKITTLSDYVEQCKEALSINRLNLNARKYLLIAYDEIVSTLKEMSDKKSS